LAGFFAIDDFPLDHLHGLLEAGLQLLLEFVLRPEGQWSLDPALVDVLGHEPADRLDEPVAGRAPRGRVVVLLDEHRREPADAAEVLDDLLDDLGGVGDVGSSGADLGDPEVDAPCLDLGQRGPSFRPRPLLLLPPGGPGTGSTVERKSPRSEPKMLL